MHSDHRVEFCQSEEEKSATEPKNPRIRGFVGEPDPSAGGEPSTIGAEHDIEHALVEQIEPREFAPRVEIPDPDITGLFGPAAGRDQSPARVNRDAVDRPGVRAVRDRGADLDRAIVMAT